MIISDLKLVESVRPSFAIAIYLLYRFGLFHFEAVLDSVFYALQTDGRHGSLRTRLDRNLKLFVWNSWLALRFGGSGVGV